MKCEKLLLLSSCPSVRKKQIGPHYRDFGEIQYLKIVPISVGISKFSLKSNMKNRYIIIQPAYICDNILLNSFYNMKYFKCRV